MYLHDGALEAIEALLERHPVLGKQPAAALGQCLEGGCCCLVRSTLDVETSEDVEVFDLRPHRLGAGHWL